MTSQAPGGLRRAPGAVQVLLQHRGGGLAAAGEHRAARADGTEEQAGAPAVPGDPGVRRQRLRSAQGQLEFSGLFGFTFMCG